MAKAILLGSRDGDGEHAIAQIDFRSDRPVSEQADLALHRSFGLLVCGWWESGEHMARVWIGGHRWKFDLRHYLERDMLAKGTAQAFQFLRYELGGKGWLEPWARINAHLIGRTFHAWMADPKPAVLEETINLPDGSSKQIQMDFRPFVNQVIKGYREGAQEDGG